MYISGWKVSRNTANFSKRNLEDLKSGARVEVDERKQDPLDFALWKASKPGEPGWKARGAKAGAGTSNAPLWASNTSARRSTFTRRQGPDFPHHENEIARASAYSGKKFVNYWLHNGFVNINQEKMSKSLGNFFTIRDILDQYDGEVVRLFLLSTHYRSPIDFPDANLKDARAGLNRYYTMKESILKVLSGNSARPGQTG